MSRNRGEDMESLIERRGPSGLRVFFYVSIVLILALIALMALGFSILMRMSAFGIRGPPGPPGPMGSIVINGTNDFVIQGNLTINGTLAFTENSTGITFPNATISQNDTCLSINSDVPLCLDVPYIQTGSNTTIFNNVTICFDINCTAGIGPIDVNGTVVLNIFGNINTPNFTLPLLIGPNGGYLDQLPGIGGGFLVASNPNSTGGIRLDTHGYGIFGNETFNDFITFVNYIRANGGVRIYNTSGFLIFDLFYGPYLGITGNSVESFIIQSNQSALLLQSLTSNVNITSPAQVSIITPRIFLSPNSRLFNSNLSFDLTSMSNQIGFFNDTSLSPLVGWIRSNNTCPISIGPLLCIQDQKVVGTLTIDSSGTIYFNTGGKIVANGTLNITAPNVFINSLTTNSFTVLGFTFFPSGISTSVIQSTGIGTNFFNGPIVAPLIQATGQLSSSGSLGVAGNTALNGPTFVNNNVTFNGPFANCSSPIFVNTGPTPCIPSCIDYFDCNVRSITYSARNSLWVANSTVNVVPTGFGVVPPTIQFGTNIDFINTNATTMTNYNSNANKSTTKTSIFSETVSGDYTNTISFNRTSISSFRKVGGTFTPPACLPLITIVINATGTPVSTPLPPPYYNFSASTCTSVEELFEYSNNTVTKNLTFMGSAMVRRTCTGGSTAQCTPFFDVATRNFPFVELLTSPTKTLTLMNTMLDSEAQTAVASLISNLVSLNLTLQSILDLFFINTTVITQIDTYTLDSYSFINATAEGQMDISASESINLGEDALVVDPVTKDITVFGEILGSDGNEHPCCGGSPAAVNAKYSRLTLTAPLVINGAIASPSSAVVNFAVSTTTGTLGGFGLGTTSTFTAPKNGIYQVSASFKISATTAVTSIGCLYEVQNAATVLQYYKFGSLYSTVASLPSDGVDTYLECAEFSTFVANGNKIQIKVFTQNPLTTAQPAAYSITLDTSSYIQAVFI